MGESRRDEASREDRKIILEEDLKNEMKNLENSRENKVSIKDNIMEIDRAGFNQENIKEGLKEVDQNVCRSITISGGGG